MKIEFYAEHEEFTWLIFEIPRDLDRVLIQQLNSYPWARVWGFRGEEQIEGTLISVNEGWVPMAGDR